MNGRVVAIVIGLMLTAMGATYGNELENALRETAAPNQEFVRTPAKYILMKLSKAATASGVPELAAFDIINELPASGDVKVSINLADMSLYDAIKAVADAAGAGVEFQQTRVVLKDPGSVVEEKPVELTTPVAPVAKTSKKSNKAEAPTVSFSDVSQALVFVENGDGRGSGFLAEMDGIPYFFSNQHNFLGATKIKCKTMNGRLLQPKVFEYSRTHDLVRMQLDPEDIKGLGVLKISTGTPAIEDAILIYGNSAGGGVATELKGKVIGVGPADIEITADIVPGNSGSPVINSKAEVIGVATYATLGQQFEKGSDYEKMFKGTRFDKVRRYGIRIPQEGWVTGELPDYLRQTYLLEDMKIYILGIYTLYQHWLGNSSFTPAAERTIAAYGSLAGKSDPPFTFKQKGTEENFRQVVISFQRKYDELQETDQRSFIGQRDSQVNAMKKLLSNGVQEIKTSAGNAEWKSRLLKGESETVIEMADEVIGQISTAKDPGVKKSK